MSADPGAVGRLFAGTSGFAYAAWKPAFYPDKLAAAKFLSYYATRLNAVEINYTFRRLAAASTFEGWIAQTPADFVFACKAHQKITHFQRLGESEFNEVFFRSLEPLRLQRRLGPVLFQLPPQFLLDLGRLEAFLKQTPEDVRCAFEFRNKSWLNEDVYAALEAHGAALCLAESDNLAIPERLTAGFVYFRLRKSVYEPEDRREIAERVAGITAGGRDAYVFFKHEETPDGALYAEELLGSQGRSEPDQRK
ncbi:MAG: DUF72 domain-containing protein [Bryobacteraceae bacterium]